MHEEYLERSRALRENRTRWVIGLEIFGYDVRVGEDLGSLRIPCGVYYGGKGVDWTPVRPP
jgi:hypothetical protein